MRSNAEFPHYCAHIPHTIHNSRAKTAFLHCSACQCALDRGIKAITLFDELHAPERSPCPPRSFIFTFSGISDRWRIERVDSTRRTRIHEKPPANLAVFFAFHITETQLSSNFI
jgi:hypothetical protein